MLTVFFTCDLRLTHIIVVTVTPTMLASAVQDVANVVITQGETATGMLLIGIIHLIRDGIGTI